MYYLHFTFSVYIQHSLANIGKWSLKLTAPWKLRQKMTEQNYKFQAAKLKSHRKNKMGTFYPLGIDSSSWFSSSLLSSLHGTLSKGLLAAWVGALKLSCSPVKDFLVWVCRTKNSYWLEETCKGLDGQFFHYAENPIAIFITLLLLGCLLVRGSFRVPAPALVFISCLLLVVCQSLKSEIFRRLRCLANHIFHFLSFCFLVEGNQALLVVDPRNSHTALLEITSAISVWSTYLYFDPYRMDCRVWKHHHCSSA